MQARKDLIKKVADAIGEDGAKPSSPYNFDKILDNYGLRHDCDKERLNSIMICCPFHSDDDPSLSFSYERRSWFCFGCEKSGDILQFLVELDRLHGNTNCTRASKANSILREDSNIKRIAGIDTVYARETSFNNFENVPFKKRKFGSSNTTVTFNSLADKIAAKGDYDLVERAVLMMQKGFTPELIDESIFNSKQKKQYSIEEMWS